MRSAATATSAGVATGTLATAARASKVSVWAIGERRGLGGIGLCAADGCSNATCHSNAACVAFFWYDASVELRASFRCVCDDGWLGDGLSCNPNPCAPGRHNCHHQAICMTDLNGVDFSCFCKEGLVGNGTECYSGKRGELMPLTIRALRAAVMFVITCESMDRTLRSRKSFRFRKIRYHYYRY